MRLRSRVRWGHKAKESQLSSPTSVMEAHHASWRRDTNEFRRLTHSICRLVCLFGRFRLDSLRRTRRNQKTLTSKTSPSTLSLQEQTPNLTRWL